MATSEEINEIILRDKERRLSISRVPSEVKVTFEKLASEEFCDDFGMTLKWLLEQALEYQELKGMFYENINSKLDLIISKCTASSEQEKIEPKMKVVKLMSGKVLKVPEKGKK
jgi:hypothetical protein